MAEDSVGLGARLASLLEGARTEGDFGVVLVCTDRGLPIAVAGGQRDDDELSALVAIFEEVVRRCRRDLGRGDVDELTVLDRVFGRLVVRPIEPAPGVRLFVLVDVERGRPWRRTTNRLCRALTAELAELCAEGAF